MTRLYSRLCAAALGFGLVVGGLELQASPLSTVPISDGDAKLLKVQHHDPHYDRRHVRRQRQHSDRPLHQVVPPPVIDVIPHHNQPRPHHRRRHHEHH